jgi:hypothetical protein
MFESFLGASIILLDHEASTNEQEGFGACASLGGEPGKAEGSGNIRVIEVGFC